MDSKELNSRFLHAWGTLGGNWGINRTMAQIHALLLLSESPLTTEEIMAKLRISRGNANMNIRTLTEWGLLNKVHKAGDRKEFFEAEKDIWKVSRLIARERRKRELEPALKILEELKTATADDEATRKMQEQIGTIYDFTKMADSTLDKFIQSNNTWFLKLFANMMS
ncbi:MAG: MarR family transcriptional regulator [Bacteroidota bacterium]